jgi:uncharacterized phage infection (PIP) family protein YhgE
MFMRVKAVWIFPLAIPLVLIVLMTFIYIGSVLNSTAHLDGLPVMVVNQDSGVSVNGQYVDEGATVVHALNSSRVLSTKLALLSAPLDEAKVVMARRRPALQHN